MATAPTERPRKRTARRAAAAGLLLVLAALGSGALYLKATGRWGVITAGASLTYREWFEGFINDPDSETYRAAVLERVIAVYRETPVGKSLPLRDDQGRVVGRFRMESAEVTQPFASDSDAARRRIYDVKLKGKGELWHETGGRVRFEGGASVSYQVDFRSEDWRIYAHFTCREIREPYFVCTHIDHLLARIFSGVVTKAGTAAIEESLQPGFTLVLTADGDTWLAAGHVGKEFRPREGPFAPNEPGAETLYNDTSRLERGFRDYLGPIELRERDELRVTVETEGEQPGASFAVDVVLLDEAAFAAYERAYPDGMETAALPGTVEQSLHMSRAAWSRSGLRGRYYLVLDYTAWGGGIEEWKRQRQAGLARYWVRVKR